MAKHGFTAHSHNFLLNLTMQHVTCDYPAVVDALMPPTAATEQTGLHNLAGQQLWIPDGPKCHLYQDRLATARKPYQSSNTSAFLALLGGKARHIVDAGANVGIMAIQYSAVAERVSCFEPTPDTRDCLLKNLVLNGASHNTTVYPYALSNDGGVMQMRNMHNNKARNYLLVTTRPTTGLSSFTFDVAVRRLDGFGLLDVDGIKVDVEGAELLLLQGAAQTIEQYKPICQVELIATALWQFKHTPQDVFDWFLERGYKAFDRNFVPYGRNYEDRYHKSDVFFVHKDSDCWINDDPRNILFDW